MNLVIDICEFVIKAKGLYDNNRIEESIRVAQQAKALLTQWKLIENMESAICLNHLGIIFFKSGYNHDALEMYERSLALHKKLGMKNKKELSNIYNNLGQVHGLLGNLKDAKFFLQEAISISEKDTISHGIHLDNLGGICLRLGEYSTAKSLIEKALSIFENLSGPINSHVATAVGNLSGVYLAQQDFYRAESYGLRALDIHEKLCGLEAPETLTDIHNMAKIYFQKCDIAQADRYVNRLISLVQSTPRNDQRFLAEILFSLMERAFNAFLLDIAERVGKHTVDILEAVEGHQSLRTLDAIVLVAHVQRSKSNFKSAINNYKKALSIYERLEKREEAAEVMIGLGKIYQNQFSFTIAIKMFQSALKIYREMTHQDKNKIASVLGNIALLHYEEEKYELADKTYEKALAEINDEEYNIERPWLIHNLALLKYHLGDYGSARILFEKAKGLWSEIHGTNHPFLATVDSNLALVYWANEDYKNAFEIFQKAEEQHEQQIQRILAIGSEITRADYAKSIQGNLYKVVSFCLSKPKSAVSIDKFAAQMLLRYKGRILDSLSHTFSQVRNNLNDSDQSKFNRLREIRKEISDLITPTLVRKGLVQKKESIKKLKQEEEKLEAELSYRIAIQRPELQTIFIDNVISELPNAGVLIDFLKFSTFNPKRVGKESPWTDVHYVAMVLHKSGVIRWYDLGEAKAIEYQTDNLLAKLRNKKSTKDEWQIESAKLYNIILSPLENCLEKVNHLLISPDGKLAIVPFAILINRNRKQISSRFLISYITSSRELSTLHDNQSNKSPSNNVVVIADPDYNADTHLNSSHKGNKFVTRGNIFSPLPGTKDESRRIDDLFNDVTIYTGTEATVDAVKAVSKPAVLHIATHGIFSPMESKGLQWQNELLMLDKEVMLLTQAKPDVLTNPMFFSGLALAGANKRNKEGNVGILTAQEISELDLQGTEIVVLSACETGLGTVKHGEEFIGFRRALGIAGAATQVTSLWKVSDKSTCVLMEYYYRLLIKGKGRAEALAMAQEHVRNDAMHEHWKHPFYWAAFISSGSWKPMKEVLGNNTNIEITNLPNSKKVTVIVPNLNLREKPNINSNIIKCLPKASILIANFEVDNWLNVSINDTNGWVIKKYVE